MLRSIFAATTLALCALLLAGCAGRVDYESGYGTEYQIGPNKWVCYYEGNSRMHESRVMDYGINSCAAVTIRKGFKYYTILEIQHGGTTDSYYIPRMPSTTTVSATPYGGTAITSGGGGGQTITSTRDSVSVTIECFNEPGEGRLNANEVWSAFQIREWPDEFGPNAKTK